MLEMARVNLYFMYCFHAFPKVHDAMHDSELPCCLEKKGKHVNGA